MSLQRYRLTVETDAASLAHADDLLTTIEAALDASRRIGETAAVWIDGEARSENLKLTTYPIRIDPDYLRARRLEEDPYDVD